MAGAREFQVGGKWYVCGRLNAFDQNHVARKLAPVLVFLAQLDGSDAQTGKDYARAWIAASGSVSNQDMDWALAALLSVVQRKENGALSPVRNDAGGMQYADIDDALSMLELAWQSLKAHGLIDVFRASPSASGEGPKQDQTSSSSGMASPSSGALSSEATAAPKV